MKKTLLIVFLISSSQIVLSQEIGFILIQVIHADEPPTKHGPLIFEITFTADELNNLVAKSYTNNYKRKKRIKPQNQIIIKAEQIQKFNGWRAISKSDFLLSELGVDITELRSANSAFKPDFQILDETIKIDSFKICSDWQFKRSFSMGGYSININLISENKSTEFLNYSSNDIGAFKFDLKAYLMIQPLLQDRIPQEFRIQGFFDKRSLLDILNYYYKVIECEGYYYNEFIEENPQRTQRENRMMIGWDFEEYLKKRNKK